MIDNLNMLFQTNVKISEGSCMDSAAIWPNNIELTICHFPMRIRDGYSKEMVDEFATKLKSRMINNGIVFLITYAPVEDKSRPFEIAKSMVNAGFTHVDNIVIQRSWMPGKRSETNLVNSHEYVLFFCNGNNWKIDRLPVRKYLNIDDDTSCIGNTWKVETGSLDDSYSFDLADLLIRMADILPSSLIFDPFSGSTAGLKVALKLGHSFVGFESDKRKLKKYQKIISDFEKTGKIR